MSYLLRHASGNVLRDKVSENNKIFFEADRLDNLAYEIVSGNPTDADSWHRFTKLKADADAKRREARQNLVHIELENKN